MLCGWEGNRRSGVVQAMRHRLSGLSTYSLKSQCMGDEHPTYVALEHGPFYLTGGLSHWAMPCRHILVCIVVHINIFTINSDVSRV